MFLKIFCHTPLPASIKYTGKLRQFAMDIWFCELTYNLLIALKFLVSAVQTIQRTILLKESGYMHIPLQGSEVHI